MVERIPRLDENNEIDPKHLPSGSSFGFSVKKYGAKGDGTTDDTVSIENAIAAAVIAGAGATVDFPTGVYRVSTLSVPGVILDGHGSATIKKIGSATDNFLTVTTTNTSKIIGFTIDANNLVNKGVINFQDSCTDTTVQDCKLINSASATLGGTFRYRGNNQRIYVRRCIIDGTFAAFYITGNMTDIAIEDNYIQNWLERGIYIMGTSTEACNRFRIIGNRIINMTLGGAVRQPIVIDGNPAYKHQLLRMEGNTVIGPNLSSTHPTTPGTDVQINIRCTKGFRITNNVSSYGGDRGFLIAGDSEQGVFANNEAMYNDTCGCGLGLNASLVSNIACTGNVMVNNGQNRQGDRTVSRAGFRAYGASNIVFVGNNMGDNQAVKTQLYGISYSFSNNCIHGPDNNAGVATEFYHLENGNTAVAAYAGDEQPAPGAPLLFSSDTYSVLSTQNPLGRTLTDPDLRCLIAPTTWASAAGQYLMGQADDANIGTSYYLSLTTTGKASFAYQKTPGGGAATVVDSTVAIPGAVDGQPLWLRATFDVDNGAGAGTITFYTSADGGIWTAYDTKPATGVAALYTSKSPLTIGLRDGFDMPFVGLLYTASFRDSIIGPVIASVDFRGTWTGVDTNKNTWINQGNLVWKPALPVDFEYRAYRGAASGYAPLDSGIKLPIAYIPTGVELSANKGVASGYVPLDSAVKIPVAYLPVAMPSTELLNGGGETSMLRNAVSAVNALLNPSGGIRFTYFTAQKTETITQLKLYNGTAASAGATLVRVGIYSVDASNDLTLVASTVNDTALISVANTVYTKALSSSWNKVAGQRYAVGIIFVGTTPPSLLGQMAGNSTTVTPNIMVSGPRLTANLAGQTDLVTPITSASLSSSAPRHYVEFLP